jgi:hypothetical protein
MIIQDFPGWTAWHRIMIILSSSKGQSYKKIGDIRVWGIRLGPEQLRVYDQPFNSLEFLKF